MGYVHTKAWYERLDGWVDETGRTDAGFQLFEQFVVDKDTAKTHTGGSCYSFGSSAKGGQPY